MRPTTLRESARATNTTSPTPRRNRTSVLLWTVQAVLALLFLFAGGMKLVMPIEAMTKEIALPGPFLRFIGVAELAGGLGLVLPGLIRIPRYLTPLAAAGLVVIMIGATSVTLVTTGAASSLVPLVVGLLCASIVYGRWWRTLPLAARRPAVAGGRAVAGLRAVHALQVVRVGA